eukprot:symbB.v1.2.020631.t3/scaffold1744.1/size103388/6
MASPLPRGPAFAGTVGAASNALLGSGGGGKRDSVNCQKSVCRISPLGASSSNSAGGQGLGSVFGGGAPSSAGLLGSGGGEKRDSVNCQKSVCRISPVGASSSNSAGGDRLDLAGGHHLHATAMQNSNFSSTMQSLLEVHEDDSLNQADSPEASESGWMQNGEFPVASVSPEFLETPGDA